MGGFLFLLQARYYSGSIWILGKERFASSMTITRFWSHGILTKNQSSPKLVLAGAATITCNASIVQLVVNWRRKNRGSLLSFLFACIGNLTYVLSICAYSPVRHHPGNADLVRHCQCMGGIFW